jgi:hypothetical protein
MILTMARTVAGNGRRTVISGEVHSGGNAGKCYRHILCRFHDAIAIAMGGSTTASPGVTGITGEPGNFAKMQRVPTGTIRKSAAVWPAGGITMTIGTVASRSWIRKKMARAAVWWCTRRNRIGTAGGSHLVTAETLSNCGGIFMAGTRIRESVRRLRTMA